MHPPPPAPPSTPTNPDVPSPSPQPPTKQVAAPVTGPHLLFCELEQFHKMRAGSVFVKLVAIVKAASWLPLKLAYDKVIFVYYRGKKICNLSKKCKADTIYIKKKHCVPETQKKPPRTILVFFFFS